MTLTPVTVSDWAGGTNPRCTFCEREIKPLEPAYLVDDGPLVCSAECGTFLAEPRHAGTVAVETCLGCLFPVDECTCFEVTNESQEETDVP